jgi:hypothetical protein
MNESWADRRARIRDDLAECFASRSGISREDFRDIFLAERSAPSVADFIAQYIGDETVIEDIFGELAGRAGIDRKKIEDHFRREESFAQFGEHLLRAGAYSGQEGGG